MIKMTRRHFIQNMLAGAILLKTAPLVIGNSLAGISQSLSDFGGLIEKRIKGHIDTISQAQALIENQEIVHPRGTGHSSMGQSLKANSYSFSPEQQDIKLDETGVTASASTTLLDIDLFLEEHGLMLPTSPDHRSLSLGGVLSVGGYGTETSKYGALIDHVLEYDLITAEGKIKRGLRPNDKSFNTPLAGLGQHGSLLSIKIKVVAKPAFTLMRHRQIPNLDYYIDQVKQYMDESTSENARDLWYAGWHHDEHWLSDGKMSFDETAEAEEGFYKLDDLRVFRKERTDNWVFKQSYKYHIWSDHFVTLENLKDQMIAAINFKNELEAKGVEVCIYSCIIKAQDKVEHFPHFSDQPYLISVGVYANIRADQREEALLAAQRQINYSRASQQGRSARPYKYGWYWDEKNPIDISTLLDV